MNLRTVAIAGSFVVIAVLEERRPVRRRVEKKSRHVARDLAVAALSGLAAAIVQERLVAPVAARVARRRLGLLSRMRLPGTMNVVAGVLLLDYTLFLWHRLNHHVPALWRFHRVHHVDLDMDAWTALRFHFGEMALAGILRMVQIRLIGPDPAAVTIWQSLLLPSIFFHHSKIALPADVERALSRVVVTPRMHATHHSAVQAESDSNWSSLFSMWDRLHGTFQLDMEQDAITIGVPRYLSPAAVTIGRVLALPLEATRDDWTVDELSNSSRVTRHS